MKRRAEIAISVVAGCRGSGNNAGYADPITFAGDSRQWRKRIPESNSSRSNHPPTQVSCPTHRRYVSRTQLLNRANNLLSPVVTDIAWMANKPFQRGFSFFLRDL